MSFLPEEHLQPQSRMNLAPMIDFLFLMLMFFATLAVTRVTTKDTEIDLVAIQPESHTAIASGTTDLTIVNLSITGDGEYRWVTDLRDHHLNNADEIQEELLRQYQKGFLPMDKSKTQVLLKIDREAQWEPILQALFAIRRAGFEARPLYEPEA